MMDTIPSNSITCLMCRGSIQYDGKNHHDYNRHLESHHGVLYHHNIFLSVNLLNFEYLKRILEEFERSGKHSDFTSKGGNFTDEVIDVEDEDANKKQDDMKNDAKVNLHNGEEKSVNKCKICDTEYPDLVDMFKCVNRHKENESIKRDLDTLREEKRRSKKRKRLTVENTSTSPNVLQIDYEGGRDERDEKRMKQQRKRQSERWKTTEDTVKEVKNNGDIGAGEERINDLMAQIDGAIKEKEKLEVTMSQNPLTPSDPLKNITSPYSATSPKTIFRCQQDQCNFKTDMNIKLKHHMKRHKQEELERISGTKTKTSLIEAVDMATALAGAIQTNNEKAASQEPTLEEQVEGEHHDSEDENMDERDKSEDESENEPGSDDGQSKSEVEDEEQDNTDKEDRYRSKSDLSLARSFDQIKNTSEIFQNCPKQLRRGSESDRTRFTLTLDSFPEGWFYRQTGSRPGDKEYLSPDFAIMRSRKAAIEYMRCMNVYGPEILNNL